MRDAGARPDLHLDGVQPADAALAHFPQASDRETGPRRANALISGALTEMFSYDSERLREADKMLVEAQEFAEPGRIYAWRCLVRQIMFVERTEEDYARLVDEADEFSRKALEMSKANPLVLALVIAIYRHFKSVDVANIHTLQG